MLVSQREVSVWQHLIQLRILHQNLLRDKRRSGGGMGMNGDGGAGNWACWGKSLKLVLMVGVLMANRMRATPQLHGSDG